MKTYQAQADVMRNHVIDQLAKYGVTDVEEKTYEQLIWILATKRAQEIDIDSDDNNFF